MLGGAAEREIQLLERIALYWGLGYQMVDDLKDVLESAAEAGKTVARDLALDRPNVASAMGHSRRRRAPGALIHLGDRTLRRLLQSRRNCPSCKSCGGDLEQELLPSPGNACAAPLGESK